MNMDHPLVLPMLLQMSLTTFLLFWLAYGRLKFIKKVGGPKGVAKAGGFPVKLVNRGDNVKNQFELPVAFYAICLLFIATGTTSTLLTTLAWVFVVSRLVHAFVHVTNNKIFPNRFLSFLIGGLALTAMIVIAITKAI